MSSNTFSATLSPTLDSNNMYVRPLGIWLHRSSRFCSLFLSLLFFLNLRLGTFYCCVFRFPCLYFCFYFVLFCVSSISFLVMFCSAIQKCACAVSCSSRRLLVALLEDHSPALPVVSSLQTIVAWFCPFSFFLNCSCWTQSKCGTSYSIVAQPSFWIVTVYYKILFAWIYTLTKLNIIILMFFFHFFFGKMQIA